MSWAEARRQGHQAHRCSVKSAVPQAPITKRLLLLESKHTRSSEWCRPSMSKKNLAHMTPLCVLSVSSGMIMERINGKSVDKIITASDFHDIYYIREMLHEVFTSLDATQRAFG